MERHPIQNFQGGYIYPRDSSYVQTEFSWSDYIEEYNEKEEYIEREYDLGYGMKHYYWKLAQYKDGKKYAVACRKYTFREVQSIWNNCQCNRCSRSILGLLSGLLFGINECPCCIGCLKEGFESEYDINEHNMKKTIASIQ
jgi:hypothetical protein